MMVVSWIRLQKESLNFHQWNISVFLPLLLQPKMLLLWGVGGTGYLQGQHKWGGGGVRGLN